MENIWLASALWIGLALASALISIRLALSVALIEIMVGAIGGNLIGMPLTPWVNYLAGLGAILLTFLAGAEVDMAVVRRNFGASVGIGFVSFLIPYVGCMLAARYLLGWDWPQAQIAGISLSTTSVAVVYAVMVETGLNKTELGKIILAACFITDLGTVLALGIVFANFTAWLLAFAAAMLVAAWLLPKFAPWYFAKVGRRVSEPDIKFLLLVLFALGGFATMVGSEAVLPAYVIGMALAPAFQHDPELPHRMRTIAFAILTPFYFLKAGSLVEAMALISGAVLITLFLGLKMATKFVGILPLTYFYKFDKREGMYTTLLMSTGLTFGSISALYGLTNHIIDQEQYTILLTAVIGSAVVPTVIAQKWFLPKVGLAKQEV
ncbi:MAG: cation:proton antiporter [Rhizobiales bacterium]|nr:cation:proton antiporter [Hyphomicrobiales bacterium]